MGFGKNKSSNDTTSQPNPSAAAQDPASFAPPSNTNNANSLVFNSRLELIEYIINKRVKNLDYIRRVHEGKAYWLNIVKVRPDDIIQFYHPETLKKRVVQWFYLGVSIAPLLQLDNGYQFIRACAQLIEEFEYHFANMAVQGMKILKSLTISNNNEDEEEWSGQYSNLEGAKDENGVSTSRAIKTSLSKVEGKIVYEYLRTPNIPCELDYCQVIYSLCDILTFVYRKLIDDSANFLETIIKIDGRLKHHFFGLISRDLNTLSMYSIKVKIARIEGFMSGRDLQQNKTNQLLDTLPPQDVASSNGEN